MVKAGGKIVTHVQVATFRITEIAVPGQMLDEHFIDRPKWKMGSCNLEMVKGFLYYSRKPAWDRCAWVLVGNVDYNARHGVA